MTGGTPSQWPSEVETRAVGAVETLGATVRAFYWLETDYMYNVVMICEGQEELAARLLPTLRSMGFRIVRCTWGYSSVEVENRALE